MRYRQGRRFFFFFTLERRFFCEEGRWSMVWFFCFFFCAIVVKRGVFSCPVLAGAREGASRVFAACNGELSEWQVDGLKGKMVFLFFWLRTALIDAGARSLWNAICLFSPSPPLVSLLHQNVLGTVGAGCCCRKSCLRL